MFRTVACGDILKNGALVHVMSEAIDTVALATDLTAAWLTNPNTRSDDATAVTFLKAVHAAVTALQTPDQGRGPSPAEHGRAVSARKSLADPNFIISMIDGKAYRTLRRHLATNGLTPDSYRKRYKLRTDYPMVAPAYSEQRRAMAHRVGFGRKPGGQLVSNASSQVTLSSERGKQARPPRKVRPGSPKPSR